MNKIVSIKKTSAIFLAIVLVAGTITLSIPSFMIGAAQAESDREQDYDDDEKSYIKYGDESSDEEKDNDDKKSYGKDDESRDEVKDYDDNDDDKKSYGKDRDRDDKSRDHDKYDDKKSYEKDSYESQYSSYGKDNIYKSKEDSSSNSVSIKKVKCNNINVNLNGIDVDIGGAPNGNGSLNGPIAEAQAAEDDEGQTTAIASPFGNNERNNNGYKQNDKDFRFVCINNNDNTVITVNETTPEPPEPEPPISECEECFEDNLNATLQEALEEAIAEGYPIFFRGEITDVFSIAEFCELIDEDATFSDLRGSLDNLFESLPNGPGADIFNEIALCIANSLGIEVPVIEVPV